MFLFAEAFPYASFYEKNNENKMELSDYSYGILQIKIVQGI